MKKIFCILLMGIGLCPISEVFSQSRNVYWVHGLSGDANSLKPHDDYFKPIYQMNTYRPSVTTAKGIQGAAQALAADANFKADASKRNIVIAHSMGGVNSVWLHKIKGSNHVGGLVSMGSPYKGAYVANNLDNGVLDALIAEGVKKGSQGIRNEPSVVAAFMTYTPVITTLNALFGTNVPTTLYKLMNDITGRLLRKTIDEQVVQSATTRNSLKVGGSDINTIQQYSSFTVPSISLYGVEDYPATLRFLSSRFSRENNTTVDVVGLVDKLYQACSSFSSAHADQSTVSLLTGNTLMFILHRKLASDWAVSRDYWNGGLQSATDVLTGCYRTQTVTETFTEWVPSTICENGIPYHNPNKGQVVNPICLQGQWVTTTTTRTVYINEPGDGLLPATSPQAMPACLKKVEMQHINHEEMKYTSSAQGYLNDIFSGKTYTTRNSTFFALASK